MTNYTFLQSAHYTDFVDYMAFGDGSASLNEKLLRGFCGFIAECAEFDCEYMECMDADCMGITDDLVSEASDCVFWFTALDNLYPGLSKSAEPRMQCTLSLLDNMEKCTRLPQVRSEEKQMENRLACYGHLAFQIDRILGLVDMSYEELADYNRSKLEARHLV